MEQALYALGYGKGGPRPGAFGFKDTAGTVYTHRNGATTAFVFNDGAGVLIFNAEGQRLTHLHEYQILSLIGVEQG